MIMGRKNPNIPETAGGSIPDTRLNVFGEALLQEARKST
jgi:hypothetical protein